MTKKMTHKTFLFAFAAFALLGAQSTFAMEEGQQKISLRQLEAAVSEKEEALKDLKSCFEEAQNALKKAKKRTQDLESQIGLQNDIKNAEVGAKFDVVDTSGKESQLAVTQTLKDKADEVIAQKKQELDQINLESLNQAFTQAEAALEQGELVFRQAHICFLARKEEKLKLQKEEQALRVRSLQTTRELEELDEAEGRLTQSMSSTRDSQPFNFQTRTSGEVDSTRTGRKKKKRNDELVDLSQSDRSGMFGQEKNSGGNSLGADFATDSPSKSLTFGGSSDQGRFNQSPTSFGDYTTPQDYQEYEEDSEKDDRELLSKEPKKRRKTRSRKKKRDVFDSREEESYFEQDNYAPQMTSRVGNLYPERTVVKPAKWYDDSLRREKDSGVNVDLITPDNLYTEKETGKLAIDESIELIQGGKYNWYNWTYKVPTRMIGWSLELVGIKTANKVSPKAYYAIHSALLKKQTANYGNGSKLSQEISDLGVGYQGTIAENMNVAHKAVAITKYGSTKVNSDIAKAAGQIKYVQGKIVQTLKEQFKEFAKLSAVEQEDMVIRYAEQEERSAKRAYYRVSSLLEEFELAAETDNFSKFNGEFRTKEAFNAAYEQARINEATALENCEKAQARLKQLQQYKKQMPNEKQRAKLQSKCAAVALMSLDDVDGYRDRADIKLKVDNKDLKKSEKMPTTIAGFETVIKRTANERAQAIDTGMKERFNPALKKKDEKKKKEAKSFSKKKREITL